MIRIAICDDEAPTRAYLASLIRAQDCPYEVVEYASAGDCLADHRGIDLLADEEYEELKRLLEKGKGQQ